MTSAYHRLLAASAISTLGDGVRFAALPLLSAATLADPLPVAAVTAATTVPWLLIGLPAGVWVDRSDRVRVMIVADLLRTGALLLALALLLVGQLGFVALLALAVLLGVGEVLFDCASFAVLPRLVPAEALEKANGRLLATQTLGRDLLGHLLGGVLYLWQRSVPLVFDAVSFLASAALLRNVPRTPPAATGDRPGLLHDVLEGVRTILRDRLLVTLTVTGGVINAVYLGQVAIFVVFVQRVLGLGPVGYAVLLAIGAAGGVAGSVVASRLVALIGRRTVLLGGLALTGLAGFGVLAGTLATTVVGYFAMGFGIMLWNVVSVAMRQQIVPDHLLGRTLGAYRLVSWGTMPAGALLFGALADVWDVRFAFGAGGCAIVVLTVLVIRPVVADARMAAPAEGQDAHG